MPIFDYECSLCGSVTEVIADANDNGLCQCDNCRGMTAKRIITASGPYLGNQDAPWLKSVGEVVDKDTPEGREFHRNPTRENRRRWMKANNLVEYEPGMSRKPPRSDFDSDRITMKLAALHQKRKAITVRGD